MSHSNQHRTETYKVCATWLFPPRLRASAFSAVQEVIARLQGTEFHQLVKGRLIKRAHYPPGAQVASTVTLFCGERVRLGGGTPLIRPSQSEFSGYNGTSGMTGDVLALNRHHPALAACRILAPITPNVLAKVGGTTNFSEHLVLWFQLADDGAVSVLISPDATEHMLSGSVAHSAKDFDGLPSDVRAFLITRYPMVASALEGAQ